MSQSVLITGLGPVTGLGVGVADNWDALKAGTCAIDRIQAFDPAGFDCQIAAEITGLKVRDYVPKTYRKATKVMARDIEFAVAAADSAARDAGLITPGTLEKGDDTPPSYPPSRTGAHIGAGLIAAELNELTAALFEARNEQGVFDLHLWGESGMTHLTPLWLLKYLPNMLACHVTIIHDAQGPSNTITCGETSATLSIGESLRVIQRGAADLCFCGGTESKINPMAFLRQQLAQRLVTTCGDQSAAGIRPFDQNANGTVLGEGGAIVTLEAAETFKKRGGQHAYAQLVGFGASQTINPEKHNTEPDSEGRGIAAAIKRALDDASTPAEQVDAIVGFASGIGAFDQAEAAALRSIFGQRLNDVPLLSPKTNWGNCGAGAGALDVCLGALTLDRQTLPTTLGRDKPLDGFPPAAAGKRDLGCVLVISTGTGGQNAALILKRSEQ